jgi:hypothetical protein
MNVTLSISVDQHALLAAHLFPGDGLEAAALLLCGGSSHQGRYRLSVREVIPLDHDKCTERSTASPGRLTLSPLTLIMPRSSASASSKSIATLVTTRIFPRSTMSAMQSCCRSFGLGLAQRFLTLASSCSQVAACSALPL